MIGMPDTSSQYAPAFVADLKRRRMELEASFQLLRFEVVRIAGIAPTCTAAAQLSTGVGRRLTVMANALAEVFVLVPPENTRATRATIGKATICLHAFLMNAVGVLDNLAWAYLYWHGIESEVGRFDVDLFKDKLQKRLPPTFLAILSSSEMVHWRETYLKPYRDALAHRIPPYIPESYLPEDLELLDATAAQINLAIAASDWNEVDRLQERRDQVLGHAYSFLHELTPPLQPLILHPQLLSDSATIELIVRKFLLSLPVPPPD